MFVCRDLNLSRPFLGLLGVMAMAVIQGGFAAPAPQDAAYDREDARLNAAYKMLSQSLDDAGRKALRDDERQWIAGRDATCNVPKGTVAKNQCTTRQTSLRADALEKRAGGTSATQTSPGVEGAWGYRTDCDAGHYVQFEVEHGAPAFSGTWSDGTSSNGDSGEFTGHMDGQKLLVRFCSVEGKLGYAQCPSYGSDDDAYVTSSGGTLTWYRPVGTGQNRTFEKYLVLKKVKPGARAPLETNCAIAR